MANTDLFIWISTVLIAWGIFSHIEFASGEKRLSLGCFGSAGACLHHNLTCSNTSRVAIEKALYGHKTWVNCTTGVIDCNDACCEYLPDSDCFDIFIADDIVDVYRNCSAHECHFRTPRLIKPCTEHSTVFQAVSSYSVVEYECTEESTIIPMCGSPSTISGTSVSAIYNPNEQIKMADEYCVCIILQEKPNTIIIEGIDVRLNVESKDCGILNFFGEPGLGQRFCSQPSLWPNMTLAQTADKSSLLRMTGLPEYVWIRFTANDTVHVTCSLNGVHTTTTQAPTTTTPSTTTLIPEPTTSEIITIEPTTTTTTMAPTTTMASSTTTTTMAPTTTTTMAPTTTTTTMAPTTTTTTMATTTTTTMASTTTTTMAPTTTTTMAPTTTTTMAPTTTTTMASTTTTTMAPTTTATMEPTTTTTTMAPTATTMAPSTTTAVASSSTTEKIQIPPSTFPPTSATATSRTTTMTTTTATTSGANPSLSSAVYTEQTTTTATTSTSSAPLPVSEPMGNGDAQLIGGLVGGIGLLLCLAIFIGCIKWKHKRVRAKAFEDQNYQTGVPYTIQSYKKITRSPYSSVGYNSKFHSQRYKTKIYDDVKLPDHLPGDEPLYSYPYMIGVKNSFNPGSIKRPGSSIYENVNIKDRNDRPPPYENVKLGNYVKPIKPQNLETTRL